MIDRALASLPIDSLSATSADWQQLAARVLDGHALEFDEAGDFACPDQDLLDLLSAAYRVRGTTSPTGSSSIF